MPEIIQPSRLGVVVLRGHHLNGIERHLRKDGDKSLRRMGEYDYDFYFKIEEDPRSYGDPNFARNDFEIHIRLFEENPLVKLVDTPDDICTAPCPFYVGENGAECKNPYAGTGGNTPEELTRITKKGDVETIRSLGFHVNGFVRFSEIFRRIVDSNWLWFGYESQASFLANLEKELHPRLVELYRR